MSANEHSYYLFARPSFIEGAARLLDLGGTLQVYNESQTDDKADAMALWQDWLATGADLRFAIHKYEREHLRETVAAGA